MLDKFKKMIINSSVNPSLLYILTVLGALSGHLTEAAIFFVGGCIGDILLEIKELLEKQTNNTINNNGENN